MNLVTKIKEKKIRSAIIGLGYVGLPLAVELAEAGVEVVGIDIDKSKVDSINNKKSYIQDVPTERLKDLVSKGMLTATTAYSALMNVDTINICVPTPFTASKDPDVSFIQDAGRQVAKHFKPGRLIVLRSTTYPETTEKVLKPILDSSGRKVGRDYFLSFVPERIDPGNHKFNTHTTPVVVGGVTEACTDLTVDFYSTFVERVVRVSSPKVAEMSKLLENIFRSVNIALVNEMAVMCERMGDIDIWEVINAASSKPFGYMPFYPGPGIGGHCILIDPYYLAWKAREYDFHSDFIELAAETNESMPFYVADRIVEALGANGIAASKARLLILGAAFKGNVEDTRHSPAIKVMELTQGKVKKIDYHDPWVPEIPINGRRFKSVPLTAQALKTADCVVILTDHKCFDYDFIFKHSRLILDARNAIKRRGSRKLYTLGNRPVKR